MCCMKELKSVHAYTHGYKQTYIRACFWWLLGCRLSLVSCVKLGGCDCEVTARVWSWNIAGSSVHVLCPCVS